MSGNFEQPIYDRISLIKSGKDNYTKPPFRRRAGYFAVSAVVSGIGAYAAAKGIGHVVDAGWLHSWADLTEPANLIAGTAMHGFADFAKDAVDGLLWFKDAALNSVGDVVEVLKHPVEAYDKITDSSTWINEKVGLWAKASVVTGSVTAAVFHRTGHKKDEEQALEQLRKKDGVKAMLTEAPRTLWKHRMKAGVAVALVASAVFVDNVPANTITHAFNHHWVAMGGAAAAAAFISRLSYTGPPTTEELNKPPEKVFPPNTKTSAVRLQVMEAASMVENQRNRGK